MQIKHRDKRETGVLVYFICKEWLKFWGKFWGKQPSTIDLQHIVNNR